MKKYTVKDFLAGKVAVKCVTDWQKETLLKACKEHGIFWLNGTPVDELFPKYDVLSINPSMGKYSLGQGDSKPPFNEDIVDFHELSFPSHRTIVITSDGDTTTAKMFVNGKEVNTTTAKRNPADKANWRIGAQTAFDRLWKRQEKPEKEKKYGGFKVGDRVVEKFGNLHGRVVCFGKGIDEEDLVGVELDNELPSGHKCMALSLDSKPHAKDRHGLWFCPDGLCHEQPTKPEVREVKRHAKVGE